MGNPIGLVANNTAHSNTRFGLRLFHLYSRKYPCDPIQNKSDPDDPWADNPSIQNTYYNFTIYKNMEDGVLAEETGNVVFENFTIAESWRSGIEFYRSNYTKEPPVLKNSAIIGVTTTNPHHNNINYTLPQGMSAIWTGRSGPTKIDRVNIYNYPAGSVVLKTCSHCDDPKFYTNRGSDIFVSGVSLTNILGQYLFMVGNGIKR